MFSLYLLKWPLLKSSTSGCSHTLSEDKVFLGSIPSLGVIYETFRGNLYLRAERRRIYRRRRNVLSLSEAGGLTRLYTNEVPSVLLHKQVQPQGRKTLTFSNFTKHTFFFPLFKNHNDIFTNLFRLILSQTQRSMWIHSSMQGTDEWWLPSSCVCSRSRHRAQTSERELNGFKPFVSVREMKFRQLQRKHSL